MPKKLLGTAGLLILLVILVSVNMISNAALKGVKADLTEGKLFTVTQGTKNILRNLPDPITLRYYFSEKLTNNNPQVADYGKRVREFLQEYERTAGGKIKLEIIDPEPFSEEEEQAVRAGMQGLPISISERVYFGLEGINSVEGRRTIPVFMPDKEEFLEYDVTSLVYDLAHPARKKLTILTGLPMAGGESDPIARAMGQAKDDDPWFLYTQLQDQYDVSMMELTATAIPEGTNVLMVVHPKDLSAQTKYAIDQYVLGGGKAIVFVDPLCEDDRAPANPNNPLQAMMAPKNSNVPELLKAWGLELEDGKVAADRKRAVAVSVGQQNRPEIVNFILYMSLQEENISRTEYISSQLQTINLGIPGILRKLDDAKTEITPLIETTTDSEELDAQKAQLFPDPKQLLKDFIPGGKKLMLAAKVSGKVATAFPDGPEGGEKAENHLSESKEPINVIVVADVDMLTDRFWVQVQRFFGQRIANLISNNADFAINSIDFLSGSEDLISIRGRSKFQRPFTLVKKIEEDARQKSASKIKELEDKVEETNKKLSELQAQKPEGSSRLITTKEQQEELEKFQLQKLETSRELRRVQLSLRKDIEQLGYKLKFINIGLIPVLVGVFAVALGAFKVRRRRRR